MFNQKQFKRLEHPDHCLIELSADDLRELFFQEYKNRKGNLVFFRKDQKTERFLKLEQLSQHQFLVLNNKKEDPIVITRWIELVNFWRSLTKDLIFYQ
jgi:hypothetical protein